MKKDIIYALHSPYREDSNIWGYRFGKGEKAACIVGAIRGNEVQQLYVCSQLVKKLEELERKGLIVDGKEVLVVPSVNPHSMNIGKRFWSIDNTDINRMFPGYDLGETTQRIAAGLFQEVKDYKNGIQFASFYLPGDFIPHIRMMKTGYEDVDMAKLFGLPYVLLRKPAPIDTTTLNYNWQVWETDAFSLYSNATDEVDEVSAEQAVSAVLRFLTNKGIIRYQNHHGYLSSVIEESELVAVKTKVGGIYRRKKIPGDEVKMGDEMAEIIHPYEGHVIDKVLAPVDGVVFFSHKKPLVTESEIVYKIIGKIHK